MGRAGPYTKYNKRIERKSPNIELIVEVIIVTSISLGNNPDRYTAVVARGVADLWNPFLGTILLEVSIGRDLGALQGLMSTHNP